MALRVSGHCAQSERSVRPCVVPADEQRMARLLEDPVKQATKTLGLILAAALLLPWSAQAQEPPALVAIRVVDTVPGKAAQFEAALKRYGEALNKVAPEEGFNVRSIAVGGPGSRYVIFRALDKPSDLKFRAVVAEAFGEEEAARVAAQFDGAVAETRAETFVPRQDLSRSMELGPFEIVLVIRVEVVNGRQQAFEDFIHKLVEATDKVAPDQTWFGYAPGIGAGTTYRFAIPMNWADLDDPGLSIPERLTKHFGEEEAAAILAANVENTVEVGNAITVNRPDLSVQPAD